MAAAAYNRVLPTCQAPGCCSNTINRAMDIPRAIEKPQVTFLILSSKEFVDLDFNRLEINKYIPMPTKKILVKPWITSFSSIMAIYPAEK